MTAIYSNRVQLWAPVQSCFFFQPQLTVNLYTSEFSESFTFKQRVENRILYFLRTKRKFSIISSWSWGNFVGLGIVIRNSEGKFIVTAIKPTKCFDKVDCVEAEATKFEARSRWKQRMFILIIRFTVYLSKIQHTPIATNNGYPVN